MMKLIHILLIGITAANCAQEKFRGAKARGNTQTATSTPAFSQTPLDVSILSTNGTVLANGGPTAGTESNFERSLELSCETTSDSTINVGSSAKNEVQAADNSRVMMNVKGQFCQTVSDNLTVLFIIDFSGSMGPNKPDDRNLSFQPATGNDPRFAGSTGKTCGRLQAIEAIMAKFKAGDKVNIGTVTFASDIVNSHSSAPVDAASFRASKMTEANKLNNFCSYIAPDASFTTQEMAVPGATVGAATNYQAAFGKAYDFLKDVPGRKAVYFITDGRPTAAGNQDPVAAGKQAAAKLKSIDNLYFNAFFLQYKQSGLQEDKQGFDNLVQTIGAPERVVRVDSAAQLAVEVGKAEAAAFDPASIVGSLTVESYQPEAPLKIIRFSQDATNPKAWIFETQAFVLLGKDSERITHDIKVSAKAKDGTNHTSRVRILYQKMLP